MNNEQQRLEAARSANTSWKKWGPYLSERQWGTVREDYSESGNAWDYFSHDQARSRAYHWGEDGLAGISRQHADALLHEVSLQVSAGGLPGVIARMMHLFATTSAEQALELGKGAAFVEIEPPAKGAQPPSRKR